MRLTSEERLERIKQVVHKSLQPKRLGIDEIYEYESANSYTIHYKNGTELQIDFQIIKKSDKEEGLDY